MSAVAIPPGHEQVIRPALERLDAERFLRRLWDRDATLWSDAPEHHAVARNRLGWLGLPERMKGEVARLEALAQEVKAEGFTQTVLLGMGGSSLAPEVLSLIFDCATPASNDPQSRISAASGGSPDGLHLTVLDTTSPAAVRAVAATHDPRTTLFVVASKSGTTIEVSTLERHFHEWVRAARGDQRGRSFVAITDPETALERLAQERKYRAVFTAPSDVGGRYSALTYFGLLPAALCGVNIAALLDHAEDEAMASGPGVAADQCAGTVLGAALGALALNGRDKVTLVTDPEYEPLGAWVEQLLAESTGKDGKGLVPIVGEPLGSPSVYGNDRAFVALYVKALPTEVEQKLAALEHAGHPILRWRDPETNAIGAEFLRWEIATAAAAAILKVDPFDEPNVAEAKQTTQATLERYLREGRFSERDPLAKAGDVIADAAPRIAESIRALGGGGADPAAWAAGFSGLGEPGDYYSLLAYMHRTPQRSSRLEHLRHVIRDARQLATTSGYGPRYLHSTGQLHKGGPNRGLFLLLTADEDDAPIPGERHGFASLIRAQALGDQQVLERRDRRVMRLHLGADVERALERLIEVFGAPVRLR